MDAFAALLDHYRHPRHRGSLPDPTAQASARNPLCGDEVAFKVRIEGKKVVAASFDGIGCVLSLGCADVLAQAARGQEAGAVATWDEAWLHDAIGMVPPPGRRRCAVLPLEALQRALVDNHPPEVK